MDGAPPADGLTRPASGDSARARLTGDESDAILVARSLIDPKACELLFGRHEETLRRVCAERLGDERLATAAARAVMLQALRELPRYQTRGTFRSWLLGLTRNYFERRPGRSNGPIEEVDERPAIENAVAALSLIQRRLIALRRAGRTCDEIAERLGLTEEAVRVLQLRTIVALDALVHRLDQTEGTPMESPTPRVAETLNSLWDRLVVAQPTVEPIDELPPDLRDLVVEVQSAPVRPGPGAAAAIEALNRADEFTNLAIEALCHCDLEKAHSEFKLSLAVQVRAAIRLVNLSEKAVEDGDLARAAWFAPQADLLFWQLPGRARVAVSLLHTSDSREGRPDYVKSLRESTEGMLASHSEVRMFLGDADYGRLIGTLRATFLPRSTPPLGLGYGNGHGNGHGNGNGTGHLGRSNVGAIPPSILSGRERQVLCLIATGLTNREIGARIGVKDITVNTFVTRIYQKLGVDNRASATAYAVGNGMCAD